MDVSYPIYCTDVEPALEFEKKFYDISHRAHRYHREFKGEIRAVFGSIDFLCVLAQTLFSKILTLT